VAGALLLPYLLALAVRPGTLPRWAPWRTAAWVAGVVLVAAALGPPLATVAHHDHRAHMAQHLLLGMYAPLGLVLGAPLTLLVGSLTRAPRRRLVALLRSRPAHVLAHPGTAALLSVGGLFLLYLTPLYAVTAERPVVHALVLTHLLLAGALLTWSIAGPDPAPNRPGMLTRVTVLVLAAGAHAFLAKLVHARADVLATGHGGPAGLREAARWMYSGGDVAEVALAVMLFTWWYRRAGRRSVTPTEVSRRSGHPPVAGTGAAGPAGPSPCRAPPARGVRRT
jgi:putative membrane protein